MTQKFQKIFVWDVDGVILDSARETHVVTVESLRRHKNEVEKTFGGKLKEYPYALFYEDRPYVDKAHHYFVHAVSRSYHGKKAAELSREEREKIYENYKTLFDQLSKTFYAVRKELQDKDMKAWHDLNPVYPGIPEAMKELREAGFKFVIVSSKDKESIWSALKHHGLSSFFKEEDILDTTTGKDRKEQMAKMLSRYGTNAEYVILDDLPSSHVSSREALKNVRVRYLGAKWGYGVGWDKYDFITVVKNPRELARELRLKKITREYLTRYKKIVRIPFLGHYVIGKKIHREEAVEKKIPHVIVYVLIRDRAGNVLLQKRSLSKKEYPGLFTVSASGHVRHLESIEKAAKREAEEELGVRLKNVRPLWKKAVSLDPNNPHRLFFPIVADYAGTLKPNPEEVVVKETRFYSETELKQLLEEKKLVPPAQNFLRLLQEKRNN